MLFRSLITEWNVIEFNFVNLLSAMLKAPIPIVSPMVFALANNRARLDVMDVATTRLAADPEMKHLITELFAEARAVLKIRNDYTHGLYVIQTSARNTLLQMQDFHDYHAGKKQSRRTITAKTLVSEVERAEELAGDIFLVFQAVVGALPLRASHESGVPSPPGTEQVYHRRIGKRRMPPQSSQP